MSSYRAHNHTKRGEAVARGVVTPCDRSGQPEPYCWCDACKAYEAGRLHACRTY